MDIAISHLKGCPIIQADILAAEDIYGPNLSALKGKTVAHPNPHVHTGMDPVPPDLMKIHHHITLTIDIMFINEVPFLMTMARDLKLGTVEALSNRQVPTIIHHLSAVVRLYKNQGFRITAVLADPEFEPIHPSFPCLNCCGAGEHVPNIECYICTVKDRVQSTYQMLPFKQIP